MNKDHVVVGFLSGTSIVLVCLSALFAVTFARIAETIPLSTQDKIR